MGSFAQVLIQEERLNTAASMLLDNFSVAAIMKHARLSREAVLDLAAELGVDPKEDPDTP